MTDKSLILDTHQLDKSGLEFIQEGVSELDEFKKNIFLTEKLLSQGQYRAAKSIFHNLASDVGGYGFKQLSSLLKAAEIMASASTSSDWAQTIADLKESLGTAIPAYLEYVKSRTER